VSRKEAASRGTSANYIANGQDREWEHGARFGQSMRATIQTPNSKSYHEIFFSNSIAYSWIKAVVLFSIFSGGLSVTSFATLFFTKSQPNITKARGNLAQIQMIYKAYCLQFDALQDFHLRQQNANLGTICNMNSAVGTVADNAATLVQDNGETEEAKMTKVKTEVSPTGIKTTAAASTVKATIVLKEIITQRNLNDVYIFYSLWNLVLV
jgi:hypothetical protein